MADELNTQVVMTVQAGPVANTPIDDTLAIEGAAADAKAVGDALALKADASSVITISVNDQDPDEQGLILVSGSDIPVSEEDTTKLDVKIAAIDGKTAADIPMSDAAGAQSIAQAIAAGLSVTADEIPLEDSSETTVAEELARLDDEKGKVKTVNGRTPGSTGNVQVDEVAYARNLVSDSSRATAGTFIERMSGGGASLGDGTAYLQQMRGAATHTGIVEEVLEMEVTAPVSGITAEIDRDTFVAYVEESGTVTLSYTTEWSADPATYGITVTGDPASGDTIAVTYVKADRGTITVAQPTAYVATGWNLYNYANGYARVLKYDYKYHVGGAYTSLAYSATPNGTQTSITVSETGSFDVPADGYVHVTGGNSTTTYITAEWQDWTTGPSGSWAAYSESMVNLSSLMGEDNAFPYGLMAVGTTYDVIDFEMGQAISRIERWDYNLTNITAAIASGRAYDADEDYIYIVRAAAVTTDISSMVSTFTASDHGIEWVDDTTIALPVYVLYGNNLKNKLERDVMTLSQQTLSSAQKAQVQQNLNVLDASEVFGLPSLSNVTDANNTNMIGRFFALGTNCANLPTATNTYYTVLCIGGTQIALRFDSGFLVNAVYMRASINNSWKAWKEVGRRRGNITVSSITAAAGFSASTAEVQVGGNMGIIQYNGLTTSTTASGWTKVGTMGDSVVAYKRTWGYLMCDNSMSSGRSTVAECRVNTDGTIEVYNPQAGEKYWGGFAFFLG